MYGGELDDTLVNRNLICRSAAMYGTMAFSSLALATGHDKTGRWANATRTCADNLLAQQWLRDINYGYYRRKARWQGSDYRTVGGYGMVRAETTFFMLAAWRATGDEIYKESMLAKFNHAISYQWDNEADAKMFGGANEGFSAPIDAPNGYGANFYGESIGEGLAVLEYREDLDRERTQSLKSDDGEAMAHNRTHTCDVVIAGGSLASAAAAVAAGEASATTRVCFLEITDWPGVRL